MNARTEIERILKLSPVMPVVVIEDPAVAPDLARALWRGGLRAIEVTLRTPAALQAIEAIARDGQKQGSCENAAGKACQGNQPIRSGFFRKPVATPSLFPLRPFTRTIPWRPFDLDDCHDCCFCHRPSDLCRRTIG